MNKIQSQKLIVLEILKREGKISRNQCLKMYITRLGAIVNLLIRDGHEFVNRSKTAGVNMWGYKDEGDYVYTLTAESFDNLKQ